MLAQNFLSAADLNLSDKERDALIGVLGMLERGEVKYTSPLPTFLSNGFNLAVWCKDGGCGTVACIGGWADKLYGTSFVAEFRPAIRLALSNPRFRLQALFVLGSHDPELVSRVSLGLRGSVTVEQAARALRNFLSRGEADWKQALQAELAS